MARRLLYLYKMGDLFEEAVTIYFKIFFVLRKQLPLNEKASK